MDNPLDNLPTGNQGFNEFDNHTHDGINSPIIDSPASSGLIKYVETVGTTLDLNGLNLNKDKAYRLIIHFDDGNFQDEPRLRLSNDSSNLYNETHEFPAGSSLSNFTSAASYISLTGGIGVNGAQIELLITKPNQLNILLNTAVTTQINKVPATARAYPIQISGIYFGSNVTSINLYVPSAQAMNWKAWLYKLTTQ